jgi:hypothetical protein
MAPDDFIAGAIGRVPAGVSTQALERPAPTPVEIEKQQSLWWFLLVAGLLVLLLEAVLSNQIAKRQAPRLAGQVSG